MTKPHQQVDEVPTQVRFKIMAFVTLVTILTYMDRLNLSIAGKSIQEELALNTQTMGWVFSAFLLGYALFQVPGGWVGDRYGPRRVLAVSIALWSIFTVLTAFAPGLPIAGWMGAVGSLMLARFLVGLGEAASSPNNNKMVANWIGSSHRGMGASFTILGIGVGGAATPPLIAAIMQRWGWRSSFIIAGVFGLLIAAAWAWYVRDKPEQHKGVNAAERQLIKDSQSLRTRSSGPAPWGRILSSRSTWGLVLGYMCQGYPIYFYHTWFFLYLVNQRGLSITKGSLLGSMPYIAIAALAPIGGLYSDYGVRRFGKKGGRRLAIFTGMGLSALLLWAGSHTKSNVPAILMLACGAGFNMFAATTFWATCIDLSEDFTGSVSGLMNTFGNLGGWLSPIVTAYLATHYGWDRALYSAAFVTLCSPIFFAMVDASHSLDEETSVLREPVRISA
jgi:ACS family glucarate transporter-like MFS transporter